MDREQRSKTLLDAARASEAEETTQSAGAFARGIVALLLASVAGIGLLQGCASDETGSEAAASPSDQAGSSAQVESASADSFEIVAAAFDASALDLDYSDRDKDASYDEASATRIVLDGASAAVDGDGVTVEGSTVTITAEGTYVVSGTLDDGQLVVEAADTDKVQVVLSGATIHNEDGPAVYVKQADKCFVTLADGTTNTLTDGANYVLEDGSDEPYATLFSCDDLTLNGAGTLNVTSAYRHAVCSKDDLVITGGTYVVEAVEDALRGRDCVKIADGAFTITAGGDGVKSNNDEDATRGFVSIDGGTFAIEAGDDGIQAQTYLRVAGGELEVAAVDDALHSDLEGLVADGALSVEAGDDAFHAETVLIIDHGSVDVTSCYEGYEAEKIYVNGGDTYIVADDDALNAAAADLTGDETDAVTTSTDASSADAATGVAPGGDRGAMSDSGEPPARDGSAMGEQQQNGGAPDNAFAEAGSPTMGDENCLVQINGGYLVLDSAGDSVDSNGSVEITGGVLLVNGPSNGGDGAFDYDLTATVSGGTVLMVGSTGMAQNFTSGTQPFAFASASGSAGDSIAIVDGDGTVVASLAATKQFGMVLVSSPAFEEGGAYSLVIGGTVTGANADGYTDGGTVSGGSTSELTASTTASGGMGGLGAGGGGMPAGQGGDVQRGMRGSGSFPDGTTA